MLGSWAGFLTAVIKEQSLDEFTLRAPSQNTQNQNSNVHHKFIPDAGQIPSIPQMNHMLPWRDLGDSPAISREGVRKAGAEDKAGFAVPQPIIVPSSTEESYSPLLIVSSTHPLKKKPPLFKKTNKKRPKKSPSNMGGRNPRL